VWYRNVGVGTGLPLLVLHGGPGSGSDYLAPLAGLGDQRPVVFYDQLGCGRSPADDDPVLWTLDRFVAEVAMVCRALRLKDFHLFGHSWGGWLALEYVLRHPRAVRSLTLASTAASIPQVRAELARLRAALPADLAEALRTHEASGDIDHPDYRAAVLEFYQRHLCRMDEWPAELVESMARERDNPAYRALSGPNELTIVGTLATWDRTGDLASITVPTLVTVGEFDEITPACARTLHRQIPGARLELFEHSAHLPHLEEPERYLDVLRAFLAERDPALPTATRTRTST
jgi:proline iminopeptidase